MGLHPLSIDLVLSNIFKYLPVDDLKTARLVCHQWKYESTFILKRVSVAFSFGSNETMKRFIKMCDKSENVPLTKFNISSHAFSEENSELLDDFLTTISPFAELISFSMDADSNYSYEIPKTVHLPQLKHLVLIGHNLDSQIPFRNKDLSEEIERFRNIPCIFQDFLRTASNLTHLGLWFDPSCKESLKSLFAFTSLHPMKKLRELELRIPLGDEQLRILSQMQLKLWKMSCDFPRSCFSKDSLKNFLASQSKSLKYLTIDNYYAENCYTVEFPRMNVLSVLKIDGKGCKSVRDVQFCNFNYAKQFPSLKKLEIGGHVEFNACWRDILPDNTLVHSVQNLVLSREYVDPAWIRRIAIIFPNLKKMKIWYSRKNQGLAEAVFKHMTNLNELTISYPSWLQEGNIDHVLTGIPKSKCKNLQKNLNLKEFINENDATSQGTKISIINLKKLRKLTLKGMDKASEDHKIANITDVCVVFALAKMNLEEITLNQSNISNEGIAYLKSKLSCKIRFLK